MQKRLNTLHLAKKEKEKEGVAIHDLPQYAIAMDLLHQEDNQPSMTKAKSHTERKNKQLKNKNKQCDLKQKKNYSL